MNTHFKLFILLQFIILQFIVFSSNLLAQELDWPPSDQWEEEDRKAQEALRDDLWDNENDIPEIPPLEEYTPPPPDFETDDVESKDHGPKGRKSKRHVFMDFENPIRLDPNAKSTQGKNEKPTTRAQRLRERYRDAGQELDLKPWLDHFGLSTPVLLTIGGGFIFPDARAKAKDRDRKFTEHALTGHARLGFFRDNPSEKKLERYSGLSLEIQQDMGIDFLLISTDQVYPINFLNSSYVVLSGRLIHLRPNLHPADETTGDDLVQQKRWNVAEGQLALIWRLGQDSHPVRVMFGPTVGGGFGFSDASIDDGIRLQYPNLKLENAQDQEATATADIGFHAIILLGDPGTQAWQLGVLANLERERSLESNLNHYKVRGETIKVFLATPEYEWEDPCPTLQLVLSYMKAHSKLKTSVSQDPIGSDDKTFWKRFDLPEMSDDDHTVDVNVYIRF
ncbi:MAG: hypothetical protein HY390_02355 [Deltaproteobacteria bacterium]|nr:hypothetical protein [Deltaproteobacteria bacterium]